MLPSWLQVHAEHRTRYESVDARYRSTETGGDEHLEFRTRLQVRLSSAHAWAYSEAQDSRITFTDSASTVGISQVLNTHLLQLHAGIGWKDVGARKPRRATAGARPDSAAPRARPGDTSANRIEWRSRYRFTPHPEVDTALTLFEEGRFATTIKPSARGRALHFYAGLELKY